MKAFFKRLAQFLQDDTGQLSAMRLLFLGWGLGTLIVWLLLSIKTATMIALPWSITGFISSLTAGKVVQSFTENNGQTSVSTTLGPADPAPVTGSAVPVAVPAPIPTPTPAPVTTVTTVTTTQEAAPTPIGAPTPIQTPVSGSIGPVVAPVAPAPAPIVVSQPLPPGTVQMP